MTLTTRLLGLAFASADTLVEVDPKGVVAFAIGAGATAGEDAGATWTGRPLADLLHDGAATLATLQGMKAGVRIPPTSILVSAGPDRVRRARPFAPSSCPRWRRPCPAPFPTTGLPSPSPVLKARP